MGRQTLLQATTVRRLALILSTSLLLTMGCSSKPPTVAPLISAATGKFRSDEYNFEAAFLEQPEILSKFIESDAGEIPSVEFLHADKAEDLFYVVACHTYPGNFSASSMSENLDAARHRFQAKGKLKLLQEQNIGIGKYPAKECWFQKPDGVLFHCLFAFHRNRDFKVVVGHGNDEHSEKLAENFIRSFAFVE